MCHLEAWSIGYEAWLASAHTTLERLSWNSYLTNSSSQGCGQNHPPAPMNLSKKFIDHPSSSLIRFLSQEVPVSSLYTDHSWDGLTDSSDFPDRPKF